MPSANPRPHIEIYTDGGCDPNPGPGGWGAILLHGPHIKEISGGARHTTNNRMELTAAIRALRLLKRPCDIDLYTDSLYLRKGITEWLPAWQRRDWRRADGRPVENVDLWKELLAASAPHTVDCHWVRGHQGHRWNERADELATAARRAGLEDTSQPESVSGVVGQDREAEDPDLPRFDLYTRGCALGNPGPGGYAAVLVDAGHHEATRADAWPLTTNNVMELWAVVAGLRSLEEPSTVTIHTSSKYVLDGATKWLAGWERGGWRTSTGRPVKHREIWEELSDIMGDHDLRWEFLPAAESDPHSEAALAAARTAAEALRDEAAG